MNKYALWSGCICVAAILMASGCASAQEKSQKTIRQESKADIVALAQELQKHSRKADEATMVMWLPEEFWRASMTQNPNTTEAQIDNFVKHIRRYTFILALDGTHGPFGAVTYKSEADIRARIQIRDSEGTFYRPISQDTIDADTKILVSIMSPFFANMLGPMGENTHFYLFPPKNVNGQRIADAQKEGTFAVQIGEREFTWRLPLRSLVPPKICPVDGERMSGAWKFCPWHGNRLLLEEEWQKARKN
ncbi:MAG: hypothetical protein ACE5MK_12645 [Acidobacteriota bacterium]